METDDMDLDTLGRMVADGFLAVDKRFDVLENRVGLLEERVETGFREVNQRLTIVENRLDTVVELLDDHSTRIKDLELAG